jgi:hypothetical protein
MGYAATHRRIPQNFPNISLGGLRPTWTLEPSCCRAGYAFASGMVDPQFKLLSHSGGEREVHQEELSDVFLWLQGHQVVFFTFVGTIVVWLIGRMAGVVIRRNRRDPLLPSRAL